MAWFHNYNRDYDRASGYNRGRNPRDTPGLRSSNFGYDSELGSRGTWGSAAGAYDRGYGRGGYWGESSTRVDYNRDYMGRQYGEESEYDYQYRQRNPEQSPFYGRQADQEVQRWARRYGYDMQFEINPRQGGGGGRGQQQGGYGGQRQGGNFGGYSNRGQTGGFGGYSGGAQSGGYGRNTGLTGRNTGSYGRNTGLTGGGYGGGFDRSGR